MPGCEASGVRVLAMLVEKYEIALSRKTLPAMTKVNGIKVVGEAGTCAQVLPLLQNQDCDIALIDIALPDQSRLRLLGSIKKDYAHIQAIMLSSFSENASRKSGTNCT
jgi:two-component system, NarL family, response regulator DevR